MSRLVLQALHSQLVTWSYAYSLVLRSEQFRVMVLLSERCSWQHMYSCCTCRSLLIVTLRKPDNRWAVCKTIPPKHGQLDVNLTWAGWNRDPDTHWSAEQLRSSERWRSLWPFLEHKNNYLELDETEQITPRFNSNIFQLKHLESLYLGQLYKKKTNLNQILQVNFIYNVQRQEKSKFSELVLKALAKKDVRLKLCCQPNDTCIRLKKLIFKNCPTLKYSLSEYC